MSPDFQGRQLNDSWWLYPVSQYCCSQGKPHIFRCLEANKKISRKNCKRCPCTHQGRTQQGWCFVVTFLRGWASIPSAGSSPNWPRLKFSRIKLQSSRPTKGERKSGPARPSLKSMSSGLFISMSKAMKAQHQNTLWVTRLPIELSTYS